MPLTFDQFAKKKKKWVPYPGPAQARVPAPAASPSPRPSQPSPRPQENWGEKKTLRGFGVGFDMGHSFRCGGRLDDEI